MDELIQPIETPAHDPDIQKPFGYVTFDPSTGDLTGSFFQVLHPDHAQIYIAVDDDVRMGWVNYCANAVRDGVEPRSMVGTDLTALKARKNDEIDRWRADANASTFPHGGKLIACDALSRSDIDGVANHIALFGTFPVGFPGGWKATDKTMLPLADADAFRAMYASMAAQGSSNFARSQELKEQLATAVTREEIEAIQWTAPEPASVEDL